MLKWYNPQVDTLRQRIRDLEGLNEVLMGENSTLRDELSRVHREKDELLGKLLKTAGVDKDIPVSQISRTQQPIHLQANARWGTRKRSLEAEAKEKYWQEKKTKQDAEKQAAELEGIVLEDKKDAS